MHIVEFESGEFAFRRWSWGWQYLANNERYWWSDSDSYIGSYCLYPTEEECRTQVAKILNTTRKYKVRRRIRL